MSKSISTQRREEAKAQAVPESITRIPVGYMDLGELKKLKRVAQRMLDDCNALRKATPQLSGPYEYALKLWQRVHSELERRELQEAERKDKGRICWEIFSPRSKTPLSMSMFDQQRHVVRTPHRKIVFGEFFTIKPEWRVEHSDPWEDFARAQQPVDLVAFEKYARDVDECIRRKRARDGSLETKEAA
jgi:hypothetical protein